MSYISINKLIDTLDKPIKTVAIYFVESYDDFYDEKKINVAPLTLGLTLSDGTKESITFNQLRDILPEIKYIKVPINIFRYIKTSKVKRIIVDGKKIEYRESYYYKSKLEFVKSFNQDKLDDLIKERKEILQANSSTSDSSDEFI
ncbi:MAG: DUF4108 domain-containing protein [Bacilli bacterium]|nr:DUF4108 domain-containing protein [Bacilli bacterium]